MSDKDKPEKKTGARIIDVKHPGKTGAEPTSKPVIVTNRPILQDPMMVEEPGGEASSGDAPAQPKPDTSKPKLQPLTAPELEPTVSSDEAPGDKPAEAAETEPAEEAEPTAAKPVVVQGEKVIKPLSPPASEAKPADETASEEPAEKADAPAEPAKTEAQAEAETSAAKKAGAAESNEDEDSEAKAEAEHDAAIQKLIDSKKNYLPINSVEKRRTKRVVILGILVSLLLAAAWVDIALDAGLIHIDNVKPLTHFFSN